MDGTDTLAPMSGAGEGRQGEEEGEVEEGEGGYPEKQREESTAVAQARALLAQGLISSDELEAVVQKDQVITAM